MRDSFRCHHPVNTTWQPLNAVAIKAREQTDERTYLWFALFDYNRVATAVSSLHTEHSVALDDFSVKPKRELIPGCDATSNTVDGVYLSKGWSAAVRR